MPLNDGSVIFPRNKHTLLPIIEKFILPNSVIYSDLWKAYNDLESAGYDHLAINHSLNFVDPDNKEIHTQNVERLWRDVKEYVKRPGIRAEYMYQYLARYLFIRSGKNHGDLLHRFLLSAAKLYPPLGERERTAPESIELGGEGEEVSGHVREPGASLPGE